MTLDEFVAQRHKDIDRFLFYWRKSMAKDADNFPRELHEGEWYEQLWDWETGDDCEG